MTGASRPEPRGVGRRPGQPADPGEVKPSGQQVAGNWLRGIRHSGFAMLSMGLLILAVVILAPGLRIFMDQRQQVADLRSQVAEQQKTVDDLRAERARWNDPSYLRAQARDRLFFVMPGETSYLIINDVEVDPAPDQPISDSLQTTKVDWVESVFQSVMTAGLSDANADKLSTLDGGDR